MHGIIFASYFYPLAIG